VLAEGLPERIGAGEVEAAIARPEPLDEPTRRRWFALYALNVARADVRLGELLDALSSSPAAETAVVAVASARGEQVGDRAPGEPVGDLRRRWLEVPLGVRWGPAHRREMAASPGLLSVTRLHATLIEAGGGEALPATAPSLSQPSADALSERWTADGLHEVSWLEAGADRRTLQLEWRGIGDVPPSTGPPADLAAWWWSATGEAALPAPEVATHGPELLRRWLLAVGDARPKWPRRLEALGEGE
jgi:hypothetical protein